MIHNQLISKKNILEQYHTLDLLYKDAINILYGEKGKIIKEVIFTDITNEIINIRCNLKNNNLKKCSLKEKTGVYIFILKNKPIYIGVAGTGNSDDLKTRVNAEVRTFPTNNNATLSKNIQDIDKLLSKEITEEDSLKLIKSSTLLVLNIGNMTEENKLKSKSLETVLIALFKPIYNK
jgi:hypothetical protein